MRRINVINGQAGKDDSNFPELSLENAGIKNREMKSMNYVTATLTPLFKRQYICS